MFFGEQLRLSSVAKSGKNIAVPPHFVRLLFYVGHFFKECAECVQIYTPLNGCVFGGSEARVHLDDFDITPFVFFVIDYLVVPF